MKQLTAIFLCALILAALSVCPAAASESPAREIKVHDAASFIEALGSDRTILLSKDGDFTITAARNTAKLPEGYAYWSEEFDGPQLNITGARNLVIKGEPAVGGFGATLYAEPRYANVLNFEDCNNIVIENLGAGHTEGGECSGGVLRFAGCRDIVLSNLRLSGSGSVGVELERTSEVSVTDCVITECTNHALYINNSTNIEFSETVFDSVAGDFATILIYGSESVSFDGCSFTGNRGSAFGVSRSEEIVVRDYVFQDCDYDDWDPSGIVIFEEGD